MKTLHTSVTFFYPLERCAGLLFDFATRCPYIISQHHYVIYPNNVQRKLGACVAWCSGVE
jgi:hypothetical protein